MQKFPAEVKPQQIFDRKGTKKDSRNKLFYSATAKTKKTAHLAEGTGELLF